MKLTQTVNILFQIMATLAQVGDVASGWVPAKYQPIAAAVLGLIQAIVAVKAHSINPDGTPAAQPYIKK